MCLWKSVLIWNIFPIPKYVICINMFKHFINVLRLLNGYKTNLMFVFDGGYKYVHEEVFI